ncbi:MAG: hypothetical protein HC846_09540, partial [Blastocatellia bacterium]|nr:hypothetical protein [Blastocatellia bacterium]
MLFGRTDNQKAEILACAVGLESLNQPAEVRIFSDSKYVIETMSGKNRMKSNREYWERLISACLTHKIEWNWMRGHAGCPFQETADRLSRAAATRKESLDKETLDRLALMMRGTPDESTVKMIHNGLKTLAAACDGAKRADGQGFNKFDSEAWQTVCRKIISHIFGSLDCPQFNVKIPLANRRIQYGTCFNRLDVFKVQMK